MNIEQQRAAFEAALRKKPEAMYWNTSDAMFWAWQAARKCDGNHGGPRCMDPECWNDSPQPAEPVKVPSDGLTKEVVSRILGYAGKTRRQVSNPCITANEAIWLANWLTAILSGQPPQPDPAMAGLGPYRDIPENGYEHRKRVQPASGEDAKRVIDCARAALDASTEDAEGRIVTPSHLAAPLSLALDDYDRTMQQERKP